MAMMNPYNYSRPQKIALDESKKYTGPRINVKNVNKNKQDAYLTQKVMNAKPEELTMMLYEGMIRFIKLAKLGVANGNVEQANKNSIKAQNIVKELESTLDHDFEFAAEWIGLYDFVYNELFEGNLSKEQKRFENALEIAEQLADTWREIIKLA